MKLTPTLLDQKEKQQPTMENFAYLKHGCGAAAIAAHKIAKGETVSFDLWTRESEKRTFVETVFIGMEINRSSKSVRVSHSNDLGAVNSYSLIASWYSIEITTEPAHIAAAIVANMNKEKGINYFLND